MEPTSKRVADAASDPETLDEAGAPDNRLSDFLSLGLRESQRPPASARRASEAPPSVGVEPESASATGTILEPESASVSGTISESAPVERKAVDAATVESDVSAGTELEPAASELFPGAPFDARVEEAPFDASIEDAPRDDVAGGTVSAEGSDLDYVVPAGWVSRKRIVAGVSALLLAVLAMLFWSSRETKAPPHPLDAHVAAVRTVHDPLPPPPPPIAEPTEPSASAEVESPVGDPNATRAPAAPGSESESGLSPPFGPNVARFPDLPTPVLLQLEQAQEQDRATKKK